MQGGGLPPAGGRGSPASSRSPSRASSPERRDAQRRRLDPGQPAVAAPSWADIAALPPAGEDGVDAMDNEY
ncbi:hypothetical protein GPECTOR_55g329 [Gonium pectorale]|uniref:Uncharacterized protein n=1 Tax=Gonium pectorale TaxID=33097 RepID=A0A150G6M5_GONPE|nr:hypothetical protein GPECTOR_55g329 [Gonium pectorale]|eukprot:KXZ45423.1 hypothetical protein GPECTOR_55g329 [Gonium pectorale]